MIYKKCVYNSYTDRVKLYVYMGLKSTRSMTYLTIIVVLFDTYMWFTFYRHVFIESSSTEPIVKRTTNCF